MWRKKRGNAPAAAATSYITNGEDVGSPLVGAKWLKKGAKMGVLGGMEKKKFN